MKGMLVSGEIDAAIGVGLDPEGLDRVGFLVQRTDFIECGLVGLVAALERLGLGRRADLAERAGQSVPELRVVGIGTEADAGALPNEGPEAWELGVAGPAAGRWVGLTGG